MKTKFTLVIVLIIGLFTQSNAQWVNLNTHATQELNAIAISGNNAVIGGIDGNFLYSSDAGVTWSDSVYYPYDEIHAAAFASPTTVVMGGLNNFYSSANSGADFTGPTHYGTWGTTADIVFTSTTNGIAVDDYCQVAASTDGGQNWTITGHACPNGNGAMHKLSFPTASVGYACGQNGNINKTTDGGATWAAVTVPGVATVAYTAMQFFDANTGFIGGRTGTGQDTFVFKKTIDGGATWIDMKYNLMAGGFPKGGALVSFSFVDSNTGYIVYTNKIFKTTDGGMTWALDYTSTVGVDVFNKILATTDVVLAVGTNGLGARLGGHNTTGLIEAKEDVKELSVYPNPASATITLGSFLVSGQSGFLQIMDATGRIVKSEKVTTNEVDVAGFSSGIYFGKLSGADNNSYTFKFVKH